VQNLLELTADALADWFAGRGLPGYRAAQLRRWLFQKRADRFDQMTDLPKALRDDLAAEFRIWTTRVARHRASRDGTEKLLLELADGQRVECVLLRDGPEKGDKSHLPRSGPEGASHKWDLSPFSGPRRSRRTVCLSTQVGCAMGCAFCASGLDGLVRNLTPGEIIEQLLRLARLLPDDERLSHVVVMGMGEPLANLDGLLVALATATDPDGLGISARRITISTVGLPAALDRLAEHDCPYHLAVSLHAPDDALRNRLVPAGRKIGIAAILAAADRYFQATGRRVTFEYVLLSGINDRPRHARKLAALLAGRSALVNLIPYNPVPGLPYQTPAPEDTARFVELLQSAGITVKTRYRKGDRIDAACGQLRRAP